MKTFISFIFFIMLSECAFAHDGDEPVLPLDKFLNGSIEFSEHGSLHYKMPCTGRVKLCRQRARKLCEDNGAVLDDQTGGLYIITRTQGEGSSSTTGFLLTDVRCK